ncbi:MAG TPA: hypothetical protein VFV23_09975 [Verrucomicrobiae bacterium]|nr:hypothetical protein [Verrucomicrobiae bacterium]
MESTHKEPKAKFTISGANVRIISGLFFALVVIWLGYSIYNDDLVLPTKYRGLVHFHGHAVWVLSGSILCFATCMVSCLIIPMNQTFHRWTRNFGWGLFVAGIIVAILETKNPHPPRLSDFLIGCFVVLCCIALFLTAINLMVATIPDDWNLFAKHYPPMARPIGNSYPSFSSRGERVVFSDEGLYFYKIFLARPGHPPFLLPWASVKSIHKCRGFFRNSYVFKIKDDVAKLKLEMPETIEQELSKLHKHSLIHN